MVKSSCCLMKGMIHGALPGLSAALLFHELRNVRERDRDVDLLGTDR